MHKQPHILIVVLLFLMTLLVVGPAAAQRALPTPQPLAGASVGTGTPTSDKPFAIVRDIAGREYVANQVIVSYKGTAGPVISANGAGTVTDAALQRLLAANGVVAQRSLVSTLTTSARLALPERLRNLMVLTLADGRSVDQVVSALNASPAIYYAEPNYVSHIAQTVTPNDPSYATGQWGLNGTFGVRAPGAWSLTTGSSSVKIAVIDTGIDPNHPDLAAKQIGGYDFVYDDSTPNDEHGHGTHVSGIAAASTNNGVGIAGVSWQSPVLSYKVCDANGSCYDSAILAAVMQAANAAGVKVMNLSLGGQYACPTSYQDAFAYARGKGITVVAAAGNSATSSPSTPAACNNVIAVGSITSSGSLSSFSNYGSWVDVVAPGSGILSSVPGGSYESWNGTSMASPFGAGVAALIYAGLGSDATATSATAERVESIMRTTARDLGAAGRDDTFGYGLIDAAAAVAETGGPDEFEADDSAAAAKPITPGMVRRHSIYPVGDADWMSLTLNDATSVSIGIIDATGSVGMNLYDAAQQPLTCTPSNIDSDFCSAFLQAGSYYIRTTEPGNDAEVQRYGVCVSLSGDCAPWINGFWPLTTLVGETVTITGTNFVQLQSVSFNGAAATDFTAVSDTEVTAVVPQTATTGPITITTLGGSSTTSWDLTVVPMPLISSFSPTNGEPGDLVTINGSSLSTVTDVYFNGTAAINTVVSDTVIEATVPDGATTGPISVAAPGGVATSSASFLVSAADPYEPNEYMDNATPLIYGDVLTDTNFHIPGDYDVFVFDGLAGERVVIDTDAVVIGSWADTWVGLYDSTGARLTYNDDENYSTGLTDSYINYTLSVSGVFYILVADYWDDGGPDYFYTLKLDGFAPPPSISGFTPTSGPAGATVTVNGTYLDSVTAVTFNGAAASSFTIISESQLTAVVPSGATTGKIAVTSPDGTATSTGNFTVIQPPTISSFSPTSAAAGATVTINGANLSNTTSVKFNGAAATSVTNVSATQVKAVVPAAATSGSISLTTAGGTATSADSFTFIPAPTISGFTPGSGLIGATVTINGTNLSGTTGVKFNTTSATSISNVSATQVTAVVPNGATTGKISLTTAGGTVVSASTFTVVTPPSISSFSPTSASVGTTVTINGANLNGTISVSFNGVAASFTNVSTTQVRAVVPAGATSGKISLTTGGGTATSSSTFTVIAGRPSISSFSPGGGAVGMEVTISGANFVNVTSVKFGTATAAFTVVSSTQIKATVPAGAKSGRINVATTAGSTTSATNFTVFPAPVISKFTPTVATVGTTVTISGKNLSGATGVTFNGTSAVILSSSSTRVVTVVPAGATTGRISLTTSGGTATSATNFVVR